MTLQILTIAPEYLSFYIAGSIRVRIPQAIDKHGVVASADCLNVPCLCWNDGDTTVTILSPDEDMPSSKPAFDGAINTHEGVVILFDANADDIATFPVPEKTTRLRVWINHPTEPDEIVVAIGG